MLPKFIYLNQPDKSDPLNERHVMCLKWGDLYLKLSWYTPRLKFEGGRISGISLFSQYRGNKLHSLSPARENVMTASAWNAILTAAELDRISAALREPHVANYDQLYAAQQALSWALDPVVFKSPYETVSGTI